MSQIYYLGLSFIFMLKNGNVLLTFKKIISETRFLPFEYHLRVFNFFLFLSVLLTVVSWIKKCNVKMSFSISRPSN